MSAKSSRGPEMFRKRSSFDVTLFVHRPTRVRELPMALKRITLLISGRGSNMVAVIDATRDGRIDGAVTQVISNRPDAAGLDHANQRGIATGVVDSTLLWRRRSTAVNPI